jgi:hypothetical protein
MTDLTVFESEFEELCVWAYSGLLKLTVNKGLEPERSKVLPV